MKHGKRLKRWQKIFLSALGKDWHDYLYIKRDAENLHFLNRETGKVEYYRR